MTSTYKLKCFSIEEKKAVVIQLENRESNAQLALEFGTAYSTISIMWKIKREIKKAFNNNFTALIMVTWIAAC